MATKMIWDGREYGERTGLEGPFRMSHGKVVYYDPKEGKYYDPSTDMYLELEEVSLGKQG